MEELTAKIADIYLHYGIKSITMDDIAGKIGISKKTLYVHYTDKKDVISKVLQYLINNQNKGINKFISDPDQNAIDKLFNMSKFITWHQHAINPVMIYDLQKYYPDLWQQVYNYKQKAVYKHIMDNVSQGIREGLYRNDINYDIIASVYVSRMEMYSTDDWSSGLKYSFEEIFKTLFMYHIRGISTPKGIDYLEKMEQTRNEIKN